MDATGNTGKPSEPELAAAPAAEGGTAATGSPEMIVVLFQSAAVRVDEKTYLRIW